MARIVGMEFYIPQTYYTYDDIARLSGLQPVVVKDKLGIIRKPVEEKLGLYEMAFESSRRLLDQHRSRDTRVVVYSGSDAKGRHVWTLATKLGHMLGLNHYYGFDVSSQCVGGIVGLDLASRLVDNGGYTLLSVATKQSWLVDYTDPSSTFMYDFSDGAVSVLVSRDEGVYQVVSSSFLSDGWFSDVVYSEDSSSKLVVHEVDNWRDRMREESKNNFLYVVEDALTQAGASKQKVSFLGLVHMKRSFHRSLLEALGLDPEKSVYLEDYGHMQGVDPFLALSLATQRRKFNAGDIVVLAAAGTGWTWGACVLEVT